ncbi:retron system putative HNH endonuclease [Vibrio splendidus]
MYSIKKSTQPRSLVTYKNDPNASYEHLPKKVKMDIKWSLLTEQGFVCAYCMTPIDENKMRIEHWACQDDNEDLELDYSNMLACCTGNENQRNEEYICDKMKSNKFLKYSPACSDHKINERIYYEHGNGTIHSNVEEFDAQLRSVLNLNYHRLVNNRKATLRAIHAKLEIVKKGGNATRNDIESLLREVHSRKTTKVKRKDDSLEQGFTFEWPEKHKPFYGFLSDYLQHKLQRK